ncbi:MAG: type II toxin-antitoxin system RelE/ParE family toxin [Hyphomonadaceae bacterium]
MHCVLETYAFDDDCKRLKISDEIRHEIKLTISNNPLSGNLISGTGGARKRRFARSNSGKRGGLRVVWYYPAEDVPVYLLALFDKGEKINLSKAERNEFKLVLSGIADDYRASTRDRVSELKRKAS